MIAQSYFVYLLKATLVSGLLFGYYLLALRNKKFHHYNRFYLLTSVGLSCLAPLLQLNWFTIKEQTPIYESTKILFDFTASTTTKIENHWTFWEYALLAFVLVAFILLALLAKQILYVYRVKKHNKQSSTVEDVCLIETDIEEAPFSFLKNLFWKKSIDINTNEGQQILKHELIHIKEKHTLDRLFSQITTIIFWLNPFYWLIQKELLMIHEFIADEKSTQEADVEAFAKMLLTAHYGKHFLSPTHSFYYSSIKRRLIMLTKSTNTKYSYARRLMVIPLATFCIAIFSFTIQKSVIAQTKSSNPKIAIQEKANNAKQTQKIRDTSSPNKLTKKEKINTDSVLVYVIDGVLITGNAKEVVNKINPQDIATVNVYKGEKALNDYGIVGANGVIEITTKKGSNTMNGNVEVVKVERVFTEVEQKPEFPGGKDEWNKFLIKTVNHNTPIYRGAPSGKYKVELSFIVDENGFIKDVEALTNPGYGTKEDAMRVILSSPQWIPAKQNGKPVSYRTKITITYQVDEG